MAETAKAVTDLQKDGFFITETLSSSLQELARESNELFLDNEITYLESPPTALEFQRDWVAKNKPVIIKGVIDHWAALKKWTHDYLRETMGDNEVTVAVTPNGYADAVTDGKFMMPEERTLTMDMFLNVLENRDDYSGVFYVQKQNSNLTDEFEDLGDDVEPHIPFATDAFGSVPDAVNIWMGDGRAVTSLHKDHYENLYCVIKGEKTFTLIPPTDQAFIPYENFTGASYEENQDEPGQWDIVDCEGDQHKKVPWIPVDPLKPDLDKYPDFSKARPLTVRVRAGETLYLPSLWYHHVQQTHACIAVNFWYDMQFDIKYTYYKFVEGLCKALRECKEKKSDVKKDSQASVS